MGGWGSVCVGREVGRRVWISKMGAGGGVVREMMVIWAPEGEKWLQLKAVSG